MLLSDQINNNQIERSAKRLKIITHPMRAQIIELLMEGKGLSVTEIFEKLQIFQTEASHHLTLLRDYGIVKRDREGKKNVYFIDAEDFNNTVSMIDTLAGQNYRRF